MAYFSKREECKSVQLMVVVLIMGSLQLLDGANMAYSITADAFFQIHLTIPAFPQTPATSPFFTEGSPPTILACFPANNSHIRAICSRLGV
jgi:hypothetical protein